ncbi:MAG: molecular chaperone [Dehalococcoidia bacterium]|nr:molecular chaperone [Dehalococcoidia bacterium]
MIVAGGLAGGLLLLIGLAIVPRVLAHYFWPIEQWYRGAPEQPIAFPHPSHVQIGGVDCLFCHRTVATEAMASIPPVEQCMFCHKIVAKDRPEIQKLAAFSQAGQPIQWLRVHRLPDHVKFVHEAHITFFTRRDEILPSQVCATCHGDVGSMQRVQQVRSLRMGDCVDCHRQNNAPTDCFVCHY